MTIEQQDTILLAWWYLHNGDSIQDAFTNLEDAFIALCEDHFGKDFIANWEPADDYES